MENTDSNGTESTNHDGILLEGFAFVGYRSFGTRFARIAPLKKMNLIIGKNNCGKSNIIRYLREHHCDFVRKTFSPRDEANRFDTFRDNPKVVNPRYGTALICRVSDIDDIVQTRFDGSDKDVQESVASILRSPVFKSNGCLYFDYESHILLQNMFKLQLKAEQLYEACPDIYWERLWGKICSDPSSFVVNPHRGGEIQIWIPKIVGKIVNELEGYISTSLSDKTKGSLANILDIPIEVISAHRQVGAPRNDSKQSNQARDWSGAGIIERLAELQNPDESQQEDKQRFNKINAFVQTVLENDSATIEIPYSRAKIIVHMDGKSLPLSSLGTGIHEVIILAVAATLLENTIICIEEPEIHLHPTLQRKLIDYLGDPDNTSNQYIIATHSAHILDTADAQIFYVTMENGESTVRSIANTKERFEICQDLGYKASDLLQANCVIWVEGPTDRIYINYWLEAFQAEKGGRKFVEGQDYVIMFYGGASFSHLSGANPEQLKEIVDDLIELRALNRNAVIIMDSDKKTSRTRIGTTKKRLQNEFNGDNDSDNLEKSGFAWITKGREIENYLSPEQLRVSVKEKTKGAFANQIFREPENNDEYSYANIFKDGIKKDGIKKEDGKKPWFTNGKGKKPYRCANDYKIELARWHVEYCRNKKLALEFHTPLEKDIRENLGKLVNFINKANGYS